MYKKALAGEINNFTGVSDPYEPPLHPEIVIETREETPEVSDSRIQANLDQRGLFEPDHEPAYSADEAEGIRAILAKLGYIES